MKHKLRYLLYALLCLVLYLCLDGAVQLSQFLRFSPLVGLKNMLPVMGGLILGPAAALGCCLGAVLGALLFPGQPGQLTAELLSVLAVSLGLWTSWHLCCDQNGISLKKKGDLLRYIALVLLWSAAAGGICRLILGPGYFGQVMGGYAATGILVGIPVIILVTSIIGVLPVLPPWRHDEPDMSWVLQDEPDFLIPFNEALEELALSRGVSMKQVFAIESCVEELSLRIFTELSDEVMDIRIYLSDSISMFLDSPGPRRNPLRVEKGEDELDLIGLTLIRHRALRASYRYSGGVNRLHIVI